MSNIFLIYMVGLDGWEGCVQEDAKGHRTTPTAVLGELSSARRNVSQSSYVSKCLLIGTDMCTGVRVSENPVLGVERTSVFYGTQHLCC